MLFWLFIILIVAGVALMLWGACTNFEDITLFIGGLLTAIGVIGFVITLSVLLSSHIGVDGDIVKYETRYEQLVYEYENDIYENDNDLGKKELMNNIQAWNEDLAWRKANQKDFWIGIFIPNIYDQFNPIKLKN